MNNPALPSSTPIVAFICGQVVANSHDVAAYFGKPHLHVLQAIDRMTKETPPAEWEFELTSYEVYRREYRAFDMSKDGFALLSAYFTGAKATDLKLKYIAAFNELQKKAGEADYPHSDFVHTDAAARAQANEAKNERAKQNKAQKLKSPRRLPAALSKARLIEMYEAGQRTTKRNASLA